MHHKIQQSSFLHLFSISIFLLIFRFNFSKKFYSFFLDLEFYVCSVEVDGGGAVVEWLKVYGWIYYILLPSIYRVYIVKGYFNILTNNKPDEGKDE